jgi:hypothetical protein
VYQFLTPADDGLVWAQSGGELSTGWRLLPNSSWGGFGKKVGPWAPTLLATSVSHASVQLIELILAFLIPPADVPSFHKTIRQVFIKGTIEGSGCWFSTDYLAQQT